MLSTLIYNAVLWGVIWTAVLAIVYELWIKPSPQPRTAYPRAYYFVTWETRDGVNTATFHHKEAAQGFQDRKHAKGVASVLGVSVWEKTTTELSFMPGALPRPKMATVPKLRLVRGRSK